VRAQARARTRASAPAGAGGVLALYQAGRSPGPARSKFLFYSLL